MFKLKVSYPDKSGEKIILERMMHSLPKINLVVSLKDVQKAKDSIERIYVDDKAKNYIVDIVFASRNPEEYGLKDLRNLIAYGASPRATISLILASKAYAFLFRVEEVHTGRYKNNRT
jgi:MoxR-like ATPase